MARFMQVGNLSNENNSNIICLYFIILGTVISKYIQLSSFYHRISMMLIIMLMMSSKGDRHGIVTDING